MSRLFDDAATDYLGAGFAILTTTPLTMACWFNSDDVTASQGLICLGYSDPVNTSRFVISAAGNIAGDPVRAFAHDAGATDPASTTTGYSANTWHHACGVFASSTSRSAYIDGGSKNTNTVSHTPINIDQTYIGVVEGAGLVNYMSGKIAEAAIWNVALTDAQVLMLSKGYCPLFVQPNNLVAYWPLIGFSSPEFYFVGGTNIAVYDAIKSDHPRIIYPSEEWLISRADSSLAVYNFSRRFKHLLIR